MEYKAQGAIEYLLIIGAAILVVAIVIVALSGIVNTGTTQTDANTVNATNDSLQCQQDKNTFKDCTATYGGTCTCCAKFKSILTGCP